MQEYVPAKDKVLELLNVTLRYCKQAISKIVTHKPAYFGDDKTWRPLQSRFGKKVSILTY